MKLNSKIVCAALTEVLEDKSWKNQMPVFDYSNVFKYFTAGGNLEDYANTLYKIGIDAILKKYPNMPTYIYYNVEAFEYRHVSYRETINPSGAQRTAFLKHIEQKLSSSKVFPFKGLVSSEVRSTAYLQHGLAMMLHDVYQPMAFQHKAKPATFKEATASIIKQCPTIIYDQPHKIFDYYPLEFVLCVPYFTTPREMPWLPGDRKFSFVDVYLPDIMGKRFRNIDIMTINSAITIMYRDSPRVKDLAHKMFERARMVAGLGSGPPPDNFQEFMLARDRARRLMKFHYDENIVSMMNINDAIEEANRRERATNEKKLLEAAKLLIDNAKKIHLEEFGK